MREDIRGTFDEVLAQLDAGDPPAAGATLQRLHPADQADVLAELPGAGEEAILATLGPGQLAALLEHFTPQERSDAVAQVGRAPLAAALDEAPAETTADTLHDLPSAEAEQVFQAMAAPERVAPLLAHPDESAGGIMTPDIVTLSPDMSAANAIDYLRLVRPEAADAYYLYVVDGEQRLLGVVGLRNLVTARPDRTMRELMDPSPLSVGVSTDQEEVLQALQHYNLRAVPVLDAEGRLAGVTTADDLIDVAQQEATEDMFRMVGLNEEVPVRKGIAPAVRRRLPWLTLNLGTAFMAGATVAVFEDTLTRAAVLAIFLPVIAGQGGNAGMQTLTLTVRAMALGEFDQPRWRRVLTREALIGLSNGIALALIVGLIVWAWQGNGWIALAVGGAMLGTMVVASLAGVLIPLGLHAMRADPALASSIFVTTVTDVMGFVLFLGLATLLITRIE